MVEIIHNGEKKCLAIIKNKTFYIMKATITSLMNEKTNLI